MGDSVTFSKEQYEEIKNRYEEFVEKLSNDMMENTAGYDYCDVEEEVVNSIVDWINKSNYYLSENEELLMKGLSKAKKKIKKLKKELSKLQEENEKDINIKLG